MTFSKHMYIRAAIVISLLLGAGATSFAGNTVSDIPTSANENRTIQPETTLYTDACDITQSLAFYDRSPVFLRIAQPRTTVNYSFDKAETYVRIYGAALLGPGIKFPYITNVVPSTTIEPTNTSILTVDATGGYFSWGAMTTDRDQVAAQIVTKNNERSLILNNTNGVTINYYYRRASDNTYHAGNFKAMINPNLTKKTACTNYYLARCGDGILDKPTGSTDGNWWIQTQDNGFIARHTKSLLPDEQCDEWALNGTPNHCKSDCSGMWSGAVQTWAAGCTITASSSTITAGQSVTITAGYTSGASATLTPALSGFTPFTFPAWNGTATDTPAITTTYTLNVQGMSWYTGNSCSTTVTVSAPPPHLSCYLTITPNPIISGQMANVARHITGGTFIDARISASPSSIRVGWGRPYEILTNVFNGNAMTQPNATGDITFTLNGQGMPRWSNQEENFICTGMLQVLPNVPPTCTLTTTTPNITLGQTAILSASYNYAALATLSPMITGLNFLYPNRSNTSIAVSPTETTTYTMNVLGVNGSGTTCSTTVNVKNDGLSITKELMSNVLYNSGDLVVFKVSFANNSSWIIHDIIVSDTLPLALEYVSSTLFGVSPPYTFGSGMLGIYQAIRYSGFDLAPGQQGYMMVAGRYKGPNFIEHRINNAFIEWSNTNTEHATAGFNVYMPSANATVVKTSNKPSYYPGEDAGFTIAVTNNGPDAISNIIVTDDRPNSCITLDTNFLSNLSPVTAITSTDPYQRQYNWSLAVGQTLYLYLTGHISNSQWCIGSYVNNAGIAYSVNGQTQTGTAAGLNFTVSTTPSSTMSFEKRLVSYGSNSWDPVVFELLYKNNGNATITNYEIVDYRPGTLNFVSASPMPTTQTPDVGWMLLRRLITTPLVPNGSGKITINGTIH